MVLPVPPMSLHLTQDDVWYTRHYAQPSPLSKLTTLSECRYAHDNTESTGTACSTTATSSDVYTDIAESRPGLAVGQRS